LVKKYFKNKINKNNKNNLQPCSKGLKALQTYLHGVGGNVSGYYV
jgi:hypothetical protein